MTSKYHSIDELIRRILKPIQTVDKLKIFPSGLTQSNIGEEWIEYTVLPNGPGVNRVSASGVVQLVITTKKGDAGRRAWVIAGILEKHLVGASVEGLQMTKGSSLSPFRDDKYLFTIPFQFGAIQ